MKQSTVLTVPSLLSILLLSLHLTSDFIHNAGELSLRGLFISVLILVVLLYGTLVLAERLSGHVIMLLGALAALGMPVIHLMTARAVAGAIDRPYAFIFVLAQIFMVRLNVDDLDQWWSTVSQKALDRSFPGVRFSGPTNHPWGREVNMIDLAGVCWHIGQRG